MPTVVEQARSGAEVWSQFCGTGSLLGATAPPAQALWCWATDVCSDLVTWTCQWEKYSKSRLHERGSSMNYHLKSLFWKKDFFTKRKSIIRDHPCCLHGSCPTSPLPATLSETELNGGCHCVWSEGCWDACQPPGSPLSYCIYCLFSVLWEYNLHSESAKIVKYVVWWIFTNQTHPHN